ncbi:MAG: adenylyltransferase/cytidyltransferase family protein, partial [Syntrophomonadaceae bacterium]|nr:adenylyltransferase/cytidyltransferase family protein [Syntrophomonadaceae bacterium]
MAKSEPDAGLAYLLEKAEESNRIKERRFLAAGFGETEPVENPRRVGIMGGTFDPIHYGHLMAANTAKFEYRMDFVIFVPSGRPPHKKERVISGAEHRYRMTLMAAESNPG